MAASRHWRAFAFGLATVLGLARRGFFIPHRHAGAAKPVGYPALVPIFDAAEPDMRALVASIDGCGEVLLGLHGPAPEPRFDQGWFTRLDAAAAYALVRFRRPGRIVEVGCGHSTRFMARAVRDAGSSTAIVCIDPSPRAALEGLGVDHIRKTLQAVDGAVLSGLSAGDILFIDSSHVAMPGTDVDRLFGELLPRLAPGVLVHVHDVTLPDAYPDSWSWRGYNEQLLVACLLQGGYRLLWSSHWVATRHADWLSGTVVDRLIRFEGALETSVWLEKKSYQ